MTQQVERNDVDINKLFGWTGVFEIINNKDEVEGLVYMRLLGDADVNRARVFAVRKSAEFRKKLRDPESDEYITTIKDYDIITKAELINYNVMFSIRDIRNQAMKEVNVKKPKEPKSDASLEEIEKFQAEVDAFPDKVKESLDSYMEKKLEKLRETLSKKDKKTLYEDYKVLIANELCEMVASRAFKDMEIYLGCYTDDTYETKFFKSFEQFDNLDTSVKESFRAAYNRLSFSMDELKKLREATP